MRGKTVVVTILNLVLFLVFLSSVAHCASSPHRFIRTFFIRHGGNSLDGGDEVILAKYDLIDINRYHYDDIAGDTWSAIKALNPDTEIFIYQMGSETCDYHDGNPLVYLNGLGRYNVSRGHSMGSLNGNNQELFLLDPNGSRIENKGYPRWYLMDFGSRDYQDYWIEATIHDLVGQPWTSDGVMADNCLSIIFGGYSGIPVTYYTNAEWSGAMNGFINAITAGMGAKGQKIWCNRCYTRKADGVAAWLVLDALKNPPYAVLEEGAFAVKYGSNDDVQFYPEDHWKRQVDLMSHIHNSKLTYLSHSDLKPGESGTDNYGKPVNFWDILWYSMTSYHIGKNEVNNNSYFGFSVGYNEVIWFEEFEYIDLGKALGLYRISNIGGVNVYFREFEKGYVYVNPTYSDVSPIYLPETCKQLDHSNFKDNPAMLSDTETISLMAHRGTILLKSNYTKGNFTRRSTSEGRQSQKPPALSWGLKECGYSMSEMSLCGWPTRYILFLPLRFASSRALSAF